MSNKDALKNVFKCSKVKHTSLCSVTIDLAGIIKLRYGMSKLIIVEGNHRSAKKLVCRSKLF